MGTNTTQTQTDAPCIAIVGSGAAGLMASAVLEASAPSDVQTVLITDRGLGASNSMMAQGGLHVPKDTASAVELMVEDMQRAGVTSDEARVRTYVRRINEMTALLLDWGLVLDVDANNDLVRRIAGGLSEPRIVGAADSIGPAVMRVLRNRIADTSIVVHTHQTVTDVRRGETGLVIETDNNDLPLVLCDAVVIATGGNTRWWAEQNALPTTNPPNHNEQLMSRLAQDLRSVDPELFQYQPFGMIDVPQKAGAGHAVPETIVGFKEVVLLDSNGDEIVDLRAGRKAITEAMFATCAAGRGVRAQTRDRVGCRLTLSRVSSNTVLDNFPSLARKLERAGLTGQDLIVEPHLHYQLGGLASEADGATEIPGLFLAGEICGGLHGQNRLMGNGLTDSLVHGAVAARSALDYAVHNPSVPRTGDKLP